jgi:hypothetical protein
VQGAGYRFFNLGYGVEDSGFWVQGLGCGVYGLRLRV